MRQNSRLKLSDARRYSLQVRTYVHGSSVTTSKEDRNFAAKSRGELFIFLHYHTCRRPSILCTHSRSLDTPPNPPWVMLQEVKCPPPSAPSTCSYALTKSK